MQAGMRSYVGKGLLQQRPWLKRGYGQTCAEAVCERIKYAPPVRDNKQSYVLVVCNIVALVA